MADHTSETDRGPLTFTTGSGYSAQILRYERLVGWVLWIGLATLLVVMGL